MGMAARTTQPEYERLNKSKLAMRFDLDRATVTKRLDANSVQPVETKSRESIYELTPQVAAILSKIDSAMDEAKLRAVTADAQLREAKVKQITGELVPIGEATEVWQRIVARLYREFTIEQPKRIALKLAKAKTVAEIRKITKTDTDRVMRSLKQDFEAFIA